MAYAAAILRNTELVLRILDFDAAAFLFLSAADRRKLQEVAIERNPLILRFLPTATDEQLEKAVAAMPEALLQIHPLRGHGIFQRILQPVLAAYAKGRRVMPYRQVAAMLVFNHPQWHCTRKPKHHGAAGKRVIRECVRRKDGPVLRALLKRNATLLRHASSYRSCRRSVLAASSNFWPHDIFKYVSPKLLRDVTFVASAMELTRAPNIILLMAQRVDILRHAMLTNSEVRSLVSLLTCRALAYVPNILLLDELFVLEIFRTTNRCHCSSHRFANLPIELAQSEALVSECYRCGHNPGPSFIKAVKPELWQKERLWQAMWRSSQSLPDNFCRATAELKTPDLLLFIELTLSDAVPYRNYGPILLELSRRTSDPSLRFQMQATLDRMSRTCTLIKAILIGITANHGRMIALQLPSQYMTAASWMRPVPLGTDLSPIGMLRRAEDCDARAVALLDARLPIVMCSLDLKQPPHRIMLSALRALGFSDPQVGVTTLSRLWDDAWSI